MSARRVVAVGLVVALAAAAADLLLLRSFEFLSAPRFFPPWRPPVALGAAPPPSGPLPATRTVDAVTLVVVDGLRLDVSQRMRHLNSLRARGCDAVVRVDFPSFSRVGYAGIFTGAGPRVHGYLSNRNRRPSPVESIADVARAAGIRTRIFLEHHTWIPNMFPNAFAEVRPLAEALPALGKGPWPNLTVVYISEPDLTGHREGGASEAYRRKAEEVDALIGRIANAVDLHREALFVATDHGHVDRGGHGGDDPEVIHVPLVAAGPDVDLHGVRRIDDIAPRIARLLGVRPPAGAAVVPPGDGAQARLLRIAVALAALTALAWLLRGPRARDLLAATAAIGAFAALYRLRGFPFSFSCPGTSAEQPWYVLQMFVFAAVALLPGAFLTRSGPRYAAATLLVAGIAVAVSGAVSGPTAAAALDHPAAAFLYHLALCYLFAAGLIGVILFRIVKVHASPADEMD